MLQQLVAIFEGKGEMVQIDTLTQLQSLRCPEDRDVILHITEMKRLKEALDAMGAPVVDNRAHSTRLKFDDFLLEPYKIVERSGSVWFGAQ